MTEELKEKCKATLKMIAKDAEADVKRMDGTPFTGTSVATMFGYHAASIKALSEVLTLILNND